MNPCVTRDRGWDFIRSRENNFSLARRLEERAATKKIELSSSIVRTREFAIVAFACSFLHLSTRQDESRGITSHRYRFYYPLLLIALSSCETEREVDCFARLIKESPSPPPPPVISSLGRASLLLVPLRKSGLLESATDRALFLHPAGAANPPSPLLR